jgi:hypothetical protein
MSNVGSMAETLGQYALAVAARFASSSGFKLSTIGMKAIGDGRFFGRLEAGDYSSYTLGRLDEAMAWMHGRWPDGADWPKAPAWPYQGPKRRSTNGKEKVKRTKRKEETAKRKDSSRRTKGEQGAQQDSGERPAD